MKENEVVPPSQRLKGILGLFIRFRERKAQLLKGVEDSVPNNSKKSQHRSPLYNELHQLLVKLFDEMKETEEIQINSVFRADMLLTAISSDSYLFQREVRDYSPEMILEQLYVTFIPSE